MVAQKFRILSKRTVRGSTLVTLSDTKQDFTVPRGKQRCMENGLYNICKFCTCLLYLCLQSNYFFELDMIFFLQHSFWEIELTKQMTDQEDRINLGKIVFHDNNQERKSWSCLGQTCSRSLIVFLSQLFVIWSSLVTFGEFTFQKLVTNQVFGLDFCAVRQDTFYPR